MAAVPTSSMHDVVDSNNKEIQALVHVSMEPEIGGHVDLSPETITQLVGCSDKHAGACAAALSLDQLEVTAANIPCDSHLILSTPDGEPINSHSAVFVDHNGNVKGTHGNLMAGNRTHSIKIPLQPNSYTNGGKRHENMAKAMTRQKNWKDHLGMNKRDIISKSTSEVKVGVDSNGETHRRILIKEHTSPLGKLVHMNPESSHPVMSVYNQKNLTRVGDNIVMDDKHVDALADTLAETLKPMTPISKSGLRIQLVPMEHAATHLDQARTAQLDFKLHRTPVNQVLKDEDAITSVTTEHIALDATGAAKPLADTQAENDAKVWTAKLGGKAPQVAETFTDATTEEGADSNDVAAMDEVDENA